MNEIVKFVTEFSIGIEVGLSEGINTLMDSAYFTISLLVSKILKYILVKQIKKCGLEHFARKISGSRRRKILEKRYKQ